MVAFKVQMAIIDTLHGETIDESVLQTLCKSRKQNSLAEWVEHCKLVYNHARTNADGRRDTIRKQLSAHSDWCSQIDAGAILTCINISSFTLNGSRKKTRSVQSFVDYAGLCIDANTRRIADTIIASIYNDAPDNDNDLYGFLHAVFHTHNCFNAPYAKTLHALLTS